MPPSNGRVRSRAEGHNGGGKGEGEKPKQTSTRNRAGTGLPQRVSERQGWQRRVLEQRHAFQRLPGETADTCIRRTKGAAGRCEGSR